MLGFSLYFLDVPTVICVFSATVSDWLWAEFVSPQVWAVSHPAILIAVLCTVTLYLRFSGCFTFLLVCVCLPAGWLSDLLCLSRCLRKHFIYPSCLVQSAVSSERWGECRKAGFLETALEQILQILYPLWLSWKEDLKLIVSWTVFTPELLEVEWEVLVSNIMQLLSVFPMHRVAFSALIPWMLS